MMSVTGVVLTYERQAQVWEDRSYYAEPETGQLMLTADQLIAASRNLEGFEASSLMLNSDPTAPVVLRQGRSQTQYLTGLQSTFRHLERLLLQSARLAPLVQHDRRQPQLCTHCHGCGESDVSLPSS